jgi:hypothetical protein
LLGAVTSVACWTTRSDDLRGAHSAVLVVRGGARGASRHFWSTSLRPGRETRRDVQLGPLHLPPLAGEQRSLRAPGPDRQRKRFDRMAHAPVGRRQRAVTQRCCAVTAFARMQLSELGGGRAIESRPKQRRDRCRRWLLLCEGKQGRQPCDWRRASRLSPCLRSAAFPAAQASFGPVVAAGSYG